MIGYRKAIIQKVNDILLQDVTLVDGDVLNNDGGVAKFEEFLEDIQAYIISMLKEVGIEISGDMDIFKMFELYDTFVFMGNTDVMLYMDVLDRDIEHKIEDLGYLLSLFTVLELPQVIHDIIFVHDNFSVKFNERVLAHKKDLDNRGVVYEY